MTRTRTTIASACGSPRFDEGITKLAGDLVGVDALEVRQLVEKQADRLFHQLKNEADRSRRSADAGSGHLVGHGPGRAGPPRLGRRPRHDHRPRRRCHPGHPGQATRPRRRPTEPTPSRGRWSATTRRLTPAELLERCEPAETTDGDVVPRRRQRSCCATRSSPSSSSTCSGCRWTWAAPSAWSTATNAERCNRRDGGCIFPGCDCPASWCDAHHVIWWENHGPTDIWNLALLCRYHHGVTHRNGWTMTAAGERLVHLDHPLRRHAPQPTPPRPKSHRPPRPHPRLTPRTTTPDADRPRRPRPRRSAPATSATHLEQVSCRACGPAS